VYIGYLWAFFSRCLSGRSEGDVVSCLVWIHSDSDLLGLCYISRCCHVMGCEPQGQFVSAGVRLPVLHCAYFFCVSVCVFYAIVCMFALFSHNVSLPLCVCVLVFVCGWLHTSRERHNVRHRTETLWSHSDTHTERHKHT